MKKLPVGIESFKELIDWDYYYVDKTLFIKELLDDRNKVSLFTRPRRFGKTLAMSMLQTFFEDERDLKGKKKDNRAYFERTEIIGAGEAYLHHMGQYPVISLSLNSAKQPEYQMVCACMEEEIQNEFDRHFMCWRGMPFRNRIGQTHPRTILCGSWWKGLTGQSEKKLRIWRQAVSLRNRSTRISPMRKFTAHRITSGTFSFSQDI